MSFKLRLTIVFFIATAFFIPGASYSQNKEELAIETEVDSSAAVYHKVMLIPYDPQFYLSDAEQDIREATKKDPPVIRESFRKNIDYNIKRAINKYRPCISLLNDVDSFPALKEVLMEIYSRTGYRYDKPMPIPVKPEKADSVEKKNIKPNKETLDSRTAPQYIAVKGDAQYMNTVLSKPGILNDFFSQYGTDLFVFVNQFEIKTNYSSCLDIANKIYKREILLHFSVFDKNGKQLAGTYITSYFPSDSNNAFDIMKNCFPELAKFVAMCTP